MTIELDTTLAQAEVLFLSFSQIVADIDRRKAEHASVGSTNVFRRRSSPVTPATDLSVLELSENLRSILKIERP
jgi:TBC1 domain family member 15